MGASTLAVGIGLAAAQQFGRRVLLVDADVYSQGLSRLAGVARGDLCWSSPDIRDHPLELTELPRRLPTLAAVSVLGFDGGSTFDPLRASAWIPRLLAHYDLVLVDVPLAWYASHPWRDWPVILALTADNVSLQAAQRCVSAPIVAAAVRAGGPLSPEPVARRLGASLLVPVPTARAVRWAADFGDAEQALARGSFARACRRLARTHEHSS